MTLSGRHWLAALVIAVTVHVGFLFGLFWQTPPPSVKSAGFGGLGGIEISLSPAGGGGAVKASAAASMSEPVHPVKTRAPIVPEPKPEATRPAKNETVALAEREPTQSVVDNEQRTPTPPPTPVKSVKPVKSKTVIEKAPRKNRPRKHALKHPKPAQPRPEPQPVKVTESVPPAPPKPRAPTHDSADKHMAMLTPSAEGVEGSPGQTAGQGAGHSDATSGGGSPPGEVANYAALIQAWLARYKRYPARARLRRIEGTALLYFVMNRKGQVLDYRIQQSAGSAILDRAVKAMIERASPLPPMPQTMHQARLELLVPIRFSLR